MNPTSETDAILARLEKLEKQNRRLKRAGLAVIAALGALILMHQALLSAIQPPGIRTLEAGTLTLVDIHGKPRVKMLGNIPMLQFLTPDGTLIALLMGTPGGPVLSLHGADGRSEVTLVVTPVGPGLGLSGPDGKSEADLGVRGDGPRLSLTDVQGFQSVLGVEHLVTTATAETHKTSAASLTLFDNKKHVIWRAP